MNKTSLKNLATCHDSLIRLANAVDEVFPIQVICGERNKADQDAAYKAKTSKKKYPNSKHNKKPSEAMDIVPDEDRNPATLDWKDIEAFERMLKIVELKAKELGIAVRLGRDFSFKDYPHVELATTSKS